MLIKFTFYFWSLSWRSLLLKCCSLRSDSWTLSWILWEPTFIKSLSRKHIFILLIHPWSHISSIHNLIINLSCETIAFSLMNSVRWLLNSMGSTTSHSTVRRHIIIPTIIHIHHFMRHVLIPWCWTYRAHWYIKIAICIVP
jgi:hypothetical protein